MKYLISSLLVLFAFAASGATPDYKKFYGTGGIVVTTNPPNGNVTIDGSGISAGATPTYVITNRYSATFTNLGAIRLVGSVHLGSGIASNSIIYLDGSTNLAGMTLNTSQFAGTSVRSIITGAMTTNNNWFGDNTNQGTIRQVGAADFRSTIIATNGNLIFGNDGFFISFGESPANGFTMTNNYALVQNGGVTMNVPGQTFNISDGAGLRIFTGSLLTMDAGSRLELDYLTANRVMITGAGSMATNHADMRLANAMTGVSDGQALVYNAASGTWTNGTVVGASGTNFNAIIINTNLITQWVSASGNTVNALRGDYQLVNLGDHTNMNFVPYPGQESNQVTTVRFRQNSTGGFYATNNGVPLMINTNPSAFTYVTYTVGDGATNADVGYSIILTNPAAGHVLAYDIPTGAFRNTTDIGSISTNGNQFGAAIPLTLKDGVVLTNAFVFGVLSNTHSVFGTVVHAGQNIYNPASSELRFGVAGATNWAINSSGSWVPTVTNTYDVGGWGNPARTNWVNDLVAKETVDTDLSYANGYKTKIWTNYVNTVSNFVFTFNTNSVELKNQTNVIFTNIVEEATASGGSLEVHIHNTTGVTMGLVWPAYGSQHGYYFQTNVNNPIITTTTLASGAHGIAAFKAFGTNIFATFTTWP